MEGGGKHLSQWLAGASRDSRPVVGTRRVLLFHEEIAEKYAGSAQSGPATTPATTHRVHHQKSGMQNNTIETDCAAIAGVISKPLARHTDTRGWLVELYREDELDAQLHPVMAYVSQTEPGVARGPHEHVDQTDYFAFIGPGDFELVLWDARPASATHGLQTRTVCGISNPLAVVIPPGVVHAYRNISDTVGWVFNAPNRLYAGEGKREPVDEIRHEADPQSPFQLGQHLGERPAA